MKILLNLTLFIVYIIFSLFIYWKIPKSDEKHTCYYVYKSKDISDIINYFYKIQKLNQTWDYESQISENLNRLLIKPNIIIVTSKFLARYHNLKNLDTPALLHWPTL